MLVKRHRRIPFKKHATYNPLEVIARGAFEKPPEFTATTTNLSDGGLHLTSNAFLEEGERLSILIYLGKETIRLSARVVWVKRASRGASSARHEMGLEFIKVPPRLIEIYNDKATSGLGSPMYEA